MQIYDICNNIFVHDVVSNLPFWVLQEKPDEYDKLVKEMGFEIRGHASDRSKTAEELAKEERTRLEELEVSRFLYHSLRIYV
jgi:hypothetical protein